MLIRGRHLGRHHRSLCGVEEACQKALIDAGECSLPAIEPIAVHLVTHGCSQRLFVACPGVDPALLGGPVVGGRVDGGDLLEPCRSQQTLIARPYRPAAGSGSVGASPVAAGETRGGLDGEERQPSTWLEDPSARTQHGVLTANSTQEVAMDDRIDRSGADGNRFCIAADRN